MSAGAPFSMALTVAKCPSSDAALTNKVYLSPEDAATFKSVAAGSPLLCGAPSGCIKLVSGLARTGPFVFTFEGHPKMAQGTVGLSGPQRKTAEVSMRESLSAELFFPASPSADAGLALSVISLEVSFRKKNDKIEGVLDTDVLAASFVRNFERQVFTVGQDVVMDYRGVTLILRVAEVTASGGGGSGRVGVLLSGTEVLFAATPGAEKAVKLSGDAAASASLFKADWDFEQLGIGGLDAEFSAIFRRAFSSRTFPPSTIRKLNIKHVKGILLYGPPGTGKTLMARQIGKMLNAVDPIIVNGPEIFSKYVGDSEKNVRELFTAAEADEAQYGDASPLHIIIFDEMDAVVRQRGSRSGDTGAGDQVVNQLLSKIDGVDALNNVLIIGMTNRKDMLDEAILRPGRLEVHIEVSLADYEGRIQIFNIHTKSMRENNMLGPDVSIEELAELTKNYTGAEIEGVVKAAASYALSRHIDIAALKDGSDTAKSSSSGKGKGADATDGEDILVMHKDFMRALDEVRPALGSSDEDYALIMKAGIIETGPKFADLMHAADLLVQQIKNSERTSLLTALIEGPPGSGKSSVAVKLAQDSGIPFVRFISADKYVSLSELSKCDRIVKTFLDAYKSPISVIIIDDIERIVEYSALGGRFSNRVLQTLIAYLNKPPPAGHSLMVFATTASMNALNALELLRVFDGVLSVPVLTTGSEVKAVLDGLGAFSPETRLTIANDFTGSVAIKRLIMMTEMAAEAADPASQFSELLISNQIDGMVKLN